MEGGVVGVLEGELGEERGAVGGYWRFHLCRVLFGCSGAIGCRMCMVFIDMYMLGNRGRVLSYRLVLMRGKLQTEDRGMSLK